MENVVSLNSTLSAKVDALSDIYYPRKRAFTLSKMSVEQIFQSTNMKSNQTIIAVDPGVGGGFAVSTAEGILLFPMPESLPDMAQLISGFKVAESHLWVEKVPKFVSKLTPSSSVATLHENYGIVQGLAYSQGYALHRVEPKVWQDPLGLGGKKSCATGPEWKRKLKSKAQELYPHLDVTLKNCDALLILHYALGGGR